MRRAGERRNSTIDIVCVCVCVSVLSSVPLFHSFVFFSNFVCACVLVCSPAAPCLFSPWCRVVDAIQSPCCVGFAEGFADDVCRDLYKYYLCQSLIILCLL